MPCKRSSITRTARPGSPAVKLSVLVIQSCMRMHHWSAVVGLSQELFLVRDDLRECIRDRCSVVVRETGSDELVKQRDHMVEAGRAISIHRRVDDRRAAARILAAAKNYCSMLNNANRVRWR